MKKEIVFVLLTTLTGPISATPDRPAQKEVDKEEEKPGYADTWAQAIAHANFEKLLQVIIPSSAEANLPNLDEAALKKMFQNSEAFGNFKDKMKEYPDIKFSKLEILQAFLDATLITRVKEIFEQMKTKADPMILYGQHLYEDMDFSLMNEPLIIHKIATIPLSYASDLIKNISHIIHATPLSAVENTVSWLEKIPFLKEFFIEESLFKDSTEEKRLFIKLLLKRIFEERILDKRTQEKMISNLLTTAERDEDIAFCVGILASASDQETLDFMAEVLTSSENEKTWSQAKMKMIQQMFQDKKKLSPRARSQILDKLVQSMPHFSHLKDRAEILEMVPFLCQKAPLEKEIFSILSSKGLVGEKFFKHVVKYNANDVLENMVNGKYVFFNDNRGTRNCENELGRFFKNNFFNEDQWEHIADRCEKEVNDQDLFFLKCLFQSLKDAGPPPEEKALKTVVRIFPKVFEQAIYSEVTFPSWEEGDLFSHRAKALKSFFSFVPGNILVHTLDEQVFSQENEILMANILPILETCLESTKLNREELNKVIDRFSLHSSTLNCLIAISLMSQESFDETCYDGWKKCDFRLYDAQERREIRPLEIFELFKNDLEGKINPLILPKIANMYVQEIETEIKTILKNIDSGQIDSNIERYHHYYLDQYFMCVGQEYISHQTPELLKGILSLLYLDQMSGAIFTINSLTNLSNITSNLQEKCGAENLKIISKQFLGEHGELFFDEIEERSGILRCEQNRLAAELFAIDPQFFPPLLKDWKNSNFTEIVRNILETEEEKKPTFFTQEDKQFLIHQMKDETWMSHLSPEQKKASETVVKQLESSLDENSRI